MRRAAGMSAVAGEPPTTQVSIPHRRLISQRLVGSPVDRVEEAVAWFGAVQAQDYLGAKWALAQRLRDATNDSLDTALNAGAILRTHVLRPTWHLVVPTDIRWMLELTGPRVRARMAPGEKEPELDERVFRRCEEVVCRTLRDERHLTRSEISTALGEAGILASGRRLGHIMMHLELRALVCSGAMRGRQQTYALLEERVAPTPPLAREEALARLEVRYFTRHGPATVRDFVWWSGLTMADARQGIALASEGLASEKVDGRPYWFASQASDPLIASPVVRPLPNYDELVVAYRDHRLSFEFEVWPSVASMSSEALRNTITVDGCVVATWRRVMRGRAVVIQPTLCRPLRSPECAGLAATIARYSEFLGTPVGVEW